MPKPPKSKAAKKPVTVAVVEWVDASGEEGPLREDEMVPGAELVTAGLLVKEDAEFVTLAQDYAARDRRYRQVMHIPKVNIRSLRKVQV